jgi:hypothetical protein
MPNDQAGNSVEVTYILSDNAVSTFQGTRPDQKIVKGDHYSSGSGFGAEFADEFAGRLGDGKNWNSAFEFVQKGAPALPPFGRISPIDAVRQLSNGDGAYCGLCFADLLENPLQELRNSQVLALSLDNYA